MVLEKTLESPLDCKEIQPVHSKGDQSWVLIGRTDAKAETPVLWPPHAKSWLIGKDSDAGRDWGHKETGTTEVEMAGWHHRLDGHEFEWTPGVGDGQGGLVCCDSRGHKESDTTEWLNWICTYVHMCKCMRAHTHTHTGMSEAENQRQKENLKTSGRKWNIKYKGTKIRISEDTLSEDIQIRERSNILEVLKENCQPIILYLVKIYFKKWRGNDCNRQTKTIKFTGRRPTLHEILRFYAQKEYDARLKSGSTQSNDKS